MALLSSERTFTIDNLKKIRPHHLAYLMLALTMILPFFLFKRAGPNYAFFAELTSAICASLFVFFASLSIKNFVIYNRVSVYLVVFASYLVFDLIIHPPIYPSLHWLYIGSILLCSLLASTLTNFAREQGIEKVFSIVCYGLMIGGLLQDVVIFLQMLHQDWLNAWIYYINRGQAYSGNIGQRNLTAHYLSWTIIATAYLVYAKKIIQPIGWSLIIFQGVFLGATNSRTLIVYILAIIILLIIKSIWPKNLAKNLIKILGITIALILIFQAATLPMLTTLQDWTSSGSNTTTSISRLNDSEGMTIRLLEWRKAWLIFLENPWFGSGWNSYAYQGFIMSGDIRFSSLPAATSLFSHSHNIILNLLVEIGAIGTLLITMAFGYLIKPLFNSEWQSIPLIVMTMLIVTGVHSLLEFPLWHLNFFLVFVILLTFLVSDDNFKSPKIISSTKTQLLKIIFIISSIISLWLCLQMYYAYWQLNDYRIAPDKNSADRIMTSQKMLDVGNKHPLIKSYSDIQAINYLIGLSPDEIPPNFDDSLYRYAHYLPGRIPGMYYLINECDGNGVWNIESWQYYSILSHYYKGSLSSYSILLSMTSKCSDVYKTVSNECRNHYISNNLIPVCSIDDALGK